MSTRLLPKLTLTDTDSISESSEGISSSWFTLWFDVEFAACKGPLTTHLPHLKRCHILATTDRSILLYIQTPGTCARQQNQSTFVMN
jgi:hypothetical protein